ncbi:carbon-nitrogen hydrolase [Xylaria bambusicola]|uniref:carbon-nitrogen hydrolase n=1 Tax=Xylaria bambusicola TaxID=326684 RepID=UPI002008E9B6|nr:carbon-nitrogen hydrolase [Xylaria bambusicola]KAI0518371.1 carbon-nitrogen hydrolase [Xylaria bambusicola]
MAGPSTKIRIATASPATQRTRQDTLAELERLAQSAGERKADFLLLPEAFLGGYPRGIAFGGKLGERPAGARDEFRKYFQGAIDLGDVVGPGGAGGMDRWVRRELGGEESVEEGTSGDLGLSCRRGDGTREELERVARETGVFIVVGLVERAGGSLYCAVAYVCPQRGVVGKRRKVMPTGMERLIWAQGSPATLKAVSTTIRGVRVNLAAAICWENYMPLLRQSLYQQNINLYFAPTADGGDAWLSLMRTIGTEGRCFVVSSNMCVREPNAEVTAEPQPRLGSTTSKEQDGLDLVVPKARRRSVFDDDGNEIVLSSPGTSTSKPKEAIADSGSAVAEGDMFGDVKYLTRGGSSIVSPYGEVLAGPQWEDSHSLIYADVDLEECVRGRLDLDTAGSYSRNDSFKLSVEGLDLDPLPYYG